MSKIIGDLLNITRLCCFSLVLIGHGALASESNSGYQTGLWYGEVQGNLNTDSVNPKIEVINIPSLYTENQIKGSTTEIYSGEMFDEDGVLSFTENIDDQAYIKINGQVVLNDNRWNVRTSTGRLVINPGWNDIEIRISNGGGLSGPQEGIGIGFDPNGGADWQTLSDNRLFRTSTGVIIEPVENTYNGMNGLFFGELSGSSNFSDAPDKTIISANPAELTEDQIKEVTTEVFSGQIFDADGVIRFTENIDDDVQVKINGEVVLFDDRWNIRTNSDRLNLTPGWNDIEIRLSNEYGLSGPIEGIGFGFDPTGGTTWQTLDPTILRPNAGGGNQNLTDFYLIDADSNTVFAQLTEGQQLELASLPASYSFSYNPAVNADGTVFIALSGAVTATRYEGAKPYTLFGDGNDNYNGNPSDKTLVEGSYQLTANDQSVNFVITNGGDEAGGDTDFYLIDADSNTVFAQLTEGQRLELASLPASYSFSYNPAVNADGTVVIALSGAVTATRNEGAKPYTLFGDGNDNYNGNPSDKTLVEGSYRLTANGQSVNFVIATGDDGTGGDGAGGDLTGGDGTGGDGTGGDVAGGDLTGGDGAGGDGTGGDGAGGDGTGGDDAGADGTDGDGTGGDGTGGSVTGDDTTKPKDEVGVNSSLGVLVAGQDASSPGLTLYVFDNDLNTSGSNCSGSCATTWPPLLLADDVPSGIAELGVITREDSTQQVSYKSRPLYYYSGDLEPGDKTGDGLGGVWHTVELFTGGVSALYDQTTELEPAFVTETNDALITRFSDRARDRHAKENHYSAYDHYLTFYWEQRTAAIEIIDYVAKGGDTIIINVRPEQFLTALEARTFYIGKNTLAEFCGNGGLVQQGNTMSYKKVITGNCREGGPLQIGDKMEFEISQFLTTVDNGRTNYYGTTYLYIVGEGLVPWDTYQTGPYQSGVELVDGVRQRDSKKIPESAWLGGMTSIHAEETHEPDNHFMQFATNLGYENGQPFVLGRRLVHTSFIDGAHDENPENGVFPEMVGLAGNNYTNVRCNNCHERNGGAAPEPVGESLDRWVFKLGDGNGMPDPQLGRVLQPKAIVGPGEGAVSIQSWTEQNGLRSPNFQFAYGNPMQFTGVIAPRLVGMGLIEAIPEVSILALQDENDSNRDGVSGRANLIVDANSGETLLGRYGWKASQPTLKHQVASALNKDMGVMTSMMPDPDCGSEQSDCGDSGTELSDEHLDNLVKYIALLGVRPQRVYDDADVVAGGDMFDNVGCVSCHTPSFQTSEFHPFSELRNQTIHPYSDFLLHDMGPGLASTLGDGIATQSEWRTAPLWGLGLSACVTGGVAGDKGGAAAGTDSNEECVPKHSYLHDGRARSIEEAILWHGGEGERAKTAYQALPDRQKKQMLDFLDSL